MSISRWYQSKGFYIAYSIMINAAQHHGFATYQEIAQAVGLPKAGSYMSRQIGGLIGAISKNEMALKRPMLSAIVVGVKGKPSDGFYTWARDLGVLKEGDDEEAFWKSECKKVYDAWKVKYRISRSK